MMWRLWLRTCRDWPLLGTTLLLVSLAVTMTGHWLVVGLVLVSHVATVIITGQMHIRHAMAALAQIRYPDLRGSVQRDTGLFQPLLSEMYERLERVEGEARSANELRTKTEARALVRQKQVRRFEAALHSFPEPFLITDSSDKLTYWNSAAQDLLQLPPCTNRDGGTSSGVTVAGLESCPAVRDLMLQTRSRSAANSLRYVEFTRTVQGQTVSYRASATHLLDDDGGSLGVVTLIHDISTERQEKSRHAEFVSSVCHELKTPMASIGAFVELLQDDEVEDPAERSRLYGFIEVQVDRLTRLVNNMLNLARIESGVIEVKRENCDLNEVLRKALQVVQPMADEKSIALVPQLSDLYLGVNIDRDLLGQAAINLMSNAIKYTPAGGEVRLRSRMEEGEAVIEVIDNGMGIPEKDLSKLFQRFFRVERNNKAAAGTGLGLALVHYIVHNIHNGRVTVQSKVDEGSCFAIAIPLGHREQSRRKAELVTSA